MPFDVKKKKWNQHVNSEYINQQGEVNDGMEAMVSFYFSVLEGQKLYNPAGWLFYNSFIKLFVLFVIRCHKWIEFILIYHSLTSICQLYFEFDYT